MIQDESNQKGMLKTINEIPRGHWGMRLGAALDPLSVPGTSPVHYQGEYA